MLTVLTPRRPPGWARCSARSRAGAALVLAVGRPDLAAVAAERVTATAGTDLDGLPRLTAADAVDAGRDRAADRTCLPGRPRLP